MMESTVLIQEESLDELLKENEGYINWLLEVGGRAAKDIYIARLSATLAGAPRAGIFAAVMVDQLGAAKFYPYTYSSGNRLSTADPINLVFTNHADASTVESQIHNYIFLYRASP